MGKGRARTKVLPLAPLDSGARGLRDGLVGRRRTNFDYDRTTDRLAYTTGTLGYGRHELEFWARDVQGLEGSRTWGFKVVRR